MVYTIMYPSTSFLSLFLLLCQFPVKLTIWRGCKHYKSAQACQKFQYNLSYFSSVKKTKNSSLLSCFDAVDLMICLLSVITKHKTAT